MAYGSIRITKTPEITGVFDFLLHPMTRYQGPNGAARV
jgi:hypothetical protein